MAPFVVIVVVNWNGKHHLKECLDSLLSITYPIYKVVVVDNGSNDGSCEFLKSHYINIHLIRNEKNLGFAQGNNCGIQFALSLGADYIVLLNNDTCVEPDFLNHLVQRGEEDREIGVLGGKVLMYSNPRIINSTGVNLNQLAYGWDRDFGEEVLKINRGGGEVLAVTGCLMVIKKKVFEEIGLLDPKFFAYYEDIDFCIRVWKYTNFKVVYVPESVVYHKFSASSIQNSSFKKYLMLRNQCLIFFKHFPIAQMLKKFPFFLMHQIWKMMEHLKGEDYRLFFSQFINASKYVMFFPLILILRFPDSFKNRRGGKRFWQKVIPEKGIPFLRSYSPDYAKIILKRHEVDSNHISNRIIMGVNDEILGEGWSSLISEFPRIRRMEGKAVCFLRNEKRYEYIQIHGLWESNARPPYLEVTIDNKMIGRRKIQVGWYTYIFPFKNYFEDGLIEICLRINPLDQEFVFEKGFAVNEIGLFPLGSPILRLMED